jgi:hypothetical protein
MSMASAPRRRPRGEPGRGAREKAEILLADAIIQGRRDQQETPVLAEGRIPQNERLAHVDREDRVRLGSGSQRRPSAGDGVVGRVSPDTARPALNNLGSTTDQTQAVRAFLEEMRRA